MNKKKYFVALIALNTVLLAFAASFDHQRRAQAQCGSNDSRKTALSGPSGKFGPVIGTVLPPRTDTSVDLLNLETGCALRQPSLEYFNSGADAIMSWVHSNGLDISSSLWPGGAACITYDMTIVPVAAKCWGTTTEQDLLDNPSLAPVPHSPRRLLVVGNGRPDTFIFRTGEGTLGMLQLVGLSEHGGGVKIRYKLINPAKSVVARSCPGPAA
jgi:hypothetical protein